MKLYNLTVPTQQVNFKQAVIYGIGQQQGLFFTNQFKSLDNIADILSMDFIQRSSHIIHHLLDGELPYAQVNDMVSTAFNFAVPIVKIDNNLSCLELFHGQTLAFKDFGARFMAQCVAAFNQKKHVTILTATSGDTGAAVAHAFYKMAGIKVKILYPQGKISNLQEKLFCTLGENIETFAVEGNFDDCQAMVKTAFDADEIRSKHNLTSANSINISRLLAQVCYYFEIASKYNTGDLVISVPSGNFGNLTAGLIARQIGAPIKRFIAATNANDTVPRYLMTQVWSPNKTIETVANAMDVSNPSNWPRIMSLFNNDFGKLQQVISASIKTDEQTYTAMRELQQKNYIAEPHTAIAYAGLVDSLANDEHGVFIATAHPAKFIETVEQVLEIEIPVPSVLAKVKNMLNLSKTISNDTSKFNDLLLK
ncbi:Threonine synthase [hydrothermal vent metagenome]|uniref:threonine synthase n=1 Tax=hydrothermal vent metagenome TaxID=652676 RepID=A0A3B0VID2_9ZZZZ